VGHRYRVVTGQVWVTESHPHPTCGIPTGSQYYTLDLQLTLFLSGCNFLHFQGCHISKLTSPLLGPCLPLFLPPVSESSFMTCHVSKLTNPFVSPPSFFPLASEPSFAMCHIPSSQHASLSFLFLSFRK
jgi:hypothetical protein